MTSRTITPSLILYLVLFTLLTTLAIARAYADDRRQDGYGHMGSGYMGMGHMGHMGHMGKGYMGSGHMMGMRHNALYMLDLSSAQRKSIRDIHRATRTQQLTLHDKLADHSDGLYTLYKADKPNAKKISAIYRKIFDIKLEQIELGIMTKNKVYDVLTKEQKNKLKELKSSGMGYGQHRGKQGRGMHHMMR